jgi:hypothetical protein
MDGLPGVPLANAEAITERDDKNICQMVETIRSESPSDREKRMDARTKFIERAVGSPIYSGDPAYNAVLLEEELANQVFTSGHSAFGFLPKVWTQQAIEEKNAALDAKGYGRGDNPR